MVRSLLADPDFGRRRMRCFARNWIRVDAGAIGIPQSVSGLFRAPICGVRHALRGGPIRMAYLGHWGCYRRLRGGCGTNGRRVGDV